MGSQLGKWAMRIGGVYKLRPLTQVVLFNMAILAIDVDSAKHGEEPCICWFSRKKMAYNVYGDTSKSHNLDRAIHELQTAGLITPTNRACKGTTQEYRLNIETAVSALYDKMMNVYPNDAQELGRIQRRSLTQ